MIQKLSGGSAPRVSAREQSRPEEFFSACPDQACLSRSVVPVPDTLMPQKALHLKEILDTSNLSQPQSHHLLSELGAIPSQMWKMLAQSGLRIVCLPPGKDLSETSAVLQFAPQDYPDRLETGSQWLRATIQQLDEANQKEWAELADAQMQKAMWSIQQGPIIADALLATPEFEELGFKPVVLSKAVTLAELQQAAGGEVNPNFHEELRLLNRDVLIEDGPTLNSTHRLLLLPYPRCQGAPLPGDHLEYLKGQNDAAMKAAMGTNYWQSSLVVVHQDFLPDPAPEAGHHRVLLHEVGHAIDHLIERIQDDNIGQQHRTLVNRLFHEDLKAADEGNNRFSSRRAEDNVREYFAEAVESYLTRDHGDSLETKPHNNHDWLKAKNPELFAHVQEIFTRQYPDNPTLEPLPAHPQYAPPQGLLAHQQKPYLEL